MEGRITTHANVMMKSDYRHSIREDEFELVIRALSKKEEFVKVTDPFDGTPMFLRTSEIEAVTIWTVDGQKKWIQLQEQITEINKNNEKPEWES